MTAVLHGLVLAHHRLLPVVEVEVDTICQHCVEVVASSVDKRLMVSASTITSSAHNASPRRRPPIPRCRSRSPFYTPPRERERDRRYRRSRNLDLPAVLDGVAVLVAAVGAEKEKDRKNKSRIFPRFTVPRRKSVQRPEPANQTPSVIHYWRSAEIRAEQERQEAEYFASTTQSIPRGQRISSLMKRIRWKTAQLRLSNAKRKRRAWLNRALGSWKLDPKIRRPRQNYTCTYGNSLQIYVEDDDDDIILQLSEHFSAGDGFQQVTFGHPLRRGRDLMLKGPAMLFPVVEEEEEDWCQDVQLREDEEETLIGMSIGEDDAEGP
ncbi:hypothetical protein M378DRAFT_19245 [Amanita muscaria Koide BX008]|uniref:Uncharacterized protein n=1 Tax=Amanita muscaria (strain Koide BX008) TaxID=946122 RepID=A0A0C2WBV8_AMAMK|nr:hypothetical protein M378DRAFT_19245 [Amanita muscaria Koide BX008]